MWLDSVCEKNGWESDEKDLYKDVYSLKKQLEFNGFFPYTEEDNLVLL